jgi:hypothetical protein
MQKNTRYVFVLFVFTLLFVAGLASVESQDYSGHSIVITSAEYITDPDSGEAGGVEYIQRDLGNGQLTQDYVYNDPRRALFNGGNAGVTYGVRTGFPSSDVNLTNFWMRESMLAWTNLQCSGLDLVENAVNPTGAGVVETFFLTGQINIALIQADLTQMGFRSAAQFPYFAANPNVLGVTFTLSWVDANGNLTDIDGNGKSDVAFREIYYNDQFNWADNGVEGRQPDGLRYFDFPTVAIHESGHGLSAAHFGNIGIQDGALVARPRASMNAIYGGTYRELGGRDNGIHCGNWAQWPNN